MTLCALKSRGGSCGVGVEERESRCLNFGHKHCSRFLTSKPFFIKIGPKLEELKSEVVSAEVVGWASG